MEEKTKRHVITPVKGICNTPSDLTCNDEQLEICENLTLENGEIVPVRTPHNKGITLPGKLQYVHSYGANKNYISFDSTTGKLYYTIDADSVDVQAFRYSGDENHLLRLKFSERPHSDITINFSSVRNISHAAVNPIVFARKDSSNNVGFIGVANSAIDTGGSGGVIIAINIYYTLYGLYYKLGSTGQSIHFEAVHSPSQSFTVTVNGTKGGNTVSQTFTIPTGGLINEDFVCDYDTVESVVSSDMLYFPQEGELGDGDDSTIEIARLQYVIPHGNTQGQYLDSEVYCGGGEYGTCDINDAGALEMVSREGSFAITNAAIYSSYNTASEYFTDFWGEVHDLSDNGVAEASNYRSISKNNADETYIDIEYNESNTSFHIGVFSASFVETYSDIAGVFGHFNATSYTTEEEYTFGVSIAHDIARLEIETTHEISDTAWARTKVVSINKGNDDNCIYTVRILSQEQAQNEQQSLDIPFIDESAIQDANGGAISYEIENDIQDKSNMSVTSVGKTLIVSTASGIYLFLWGVGESSGVWNYKAYSQGIPYPEFAFDLVPAEEFYEEPVPSSGFEGSDNEQQIYVQEKNKGNAEDTVTASLAASKNKAAKEKKFVFPFFARCALEMVDGSYLYISNPVLLYPYVAKSTSADDGPATLFLDWNEARNPTTAKTLLVGSSLRLKQTVNYSAYSDIIKGITVFVSPQVQILEADIPKTGGKTYDSLYLKWAKNVTGGTYEWDYYLFGRNGALEKKDKSILWSSNPWQTLAWHNIFKRKSDSDIKRELVAKSGLYYKLCEVGLEPLTNGKILDEYIETSTVETIETQTSISEEDFYGHTQYTAEGATSFNRRLNLYGVKRSFFDGFAHHCNIGSGSSITMYAYVRIYTESGNVYVRKTLNATENFTGKFWFYYPDTRAKEYWIYRRDGNSYYLIAHDYLREHENLNGAYNLMSIPIAINYPNGSGTSATPPNVSNTKEELHGYLLQSAADNPLYFSASSYVHVNAGRIIGIGALTTALNNDAYMVSTTVCFTEKGIWALLSNDEGVYKQVLPPFSREVCSNGKSIVMIDGGIFFASPKGLMLVTGLSEARVLYLSANLAWKDNNDFVSFVQDCEFAYDYRAQQLIMFKEGVSKMWIYSITSKTFSTCVNFFDSTTTKIKTASNDYPDYIIQDGSLKIHSLTERLSKDSDTALYSGTIQSRPMKLDGSLYLKSLRRARSLKVLNDNATAILKLYGSNDLKHWSELHSLNGKGYRFFKYRYEFTNLKATDSYSGLVLDTQVRYTDRPH